MTPKDGLHMPVVPLFPAGSMGIWKTHAVFSAVRVCHENYLGVDPPRMRPCTLLSAPLHAGMIQPANGAGGVRGLIDLFARSYSQGLM